jgi:hypothetical protein
MPDKVNEQNTRTGEIPRVGAEPRVRYEPAIPPATTDAEPAASATGIWRIVSEKDDDSAPRDSDQPTLNKD